MAGFKAVARGRSAGHADDDGDAKRIRLPLDPMSGGDIKARDRIRKKATAFQLFVRQVARKARTRGDPNDRHYDREVERAARRMKPETLDALLRDDEDDG